MKNVVAGPEKVTRIPRTATEIFDQQGFIKSKIDQIASQAQVPKGLFFHYLGNKWALYLDAFKYAYHRTYDHMDPRKWQDALGLAAMITTAVKYEPKLQFKPPAEYRLMMQVHVDLPYFPESLRQQVQQETTAIFAETDCIFREKIEQLPRREGLSVDNVFGVVSALIAQQTTVTTRLIASGRYRRFEDLQSVVETMAHQLLIVEHGSLPDESRRQLIDQKRPLGYTSVAVFISVLY